MKHRRQFSHLKWGRVPRPLWPLFNWFWAITSLWSMTLEGNLTWWCKDDIHHRERKLDYELRVPRLPWRLYCWWRGHCDEYYGYCIFCERKMGR